MMTVNINFEDRWIVILKNGDDRDLNMINVVWKKKLCITLQELPWRAYKWYLAGMATKYTSIF